MEKKAQRSHSANKNTIAHRMSYKAFTTNTHVKSR